MPAADYNVAPTTHQPIIRQSRETGERELILARWGLIPFFTKDLKEIKGLSTINARAETIGTSRTWREPMKKRRCLIPVNAFYEWPKEGKPPKQPYAFELSSGSIRGYMGCLEGRGGPLAPVLRHCDDGGKRADGADTSAYASHLAFSGL
jgi:putative SOS response-associated peptidase YedK